MLWLLHSKDARFRRLGFVTRSFKIYLLAFQVFLVGTLKSSVKQEILRFFHFVLSYLLANNDVNLKGQIKKIKGQMNGFYLLILLVVQRALCTLSKHSTSELHHNSQTTAFWVFSTQRKFKCVKAQIHE